MRFLDGYAKLFKLMTTLISHLNMPTSSKLFDYIRGASLAPEFSPIMDSYFSAGGKIEWALDAVINRACIDYGNNVAEEQVWNGLPLCKNDKAYFLVRTRMGIPLDERWGSCISPEMLEDEHMRRVGSTGDRRLSLQATMSRFGSSG